MLAIFMLPSAALIGLASYIAVWEVNIFGARGDRSWYAFAVSITCTWLFVGVYWVMLWRRSVIWTSDRMRATALAIVAAAVIAVIVGALCRYVDEEFGLFVFECTAILAWLPMTVFIWRENALERAQRLSGSSDSALSCPICGYNLTGLSSARCPECGSTFTIDELVRRQPSREQVEIS